MDTPALEKRIGKAITKAIADYDLVVQGDRVMVCMSGGKDSYALLHFMQRGQRFSPNRFEIVAVHLAQGHPGFPLHTLRDYLARSGVEWHIVERDTYSVVQDKLQPGQTTCSLCSRLRRGILYDTAVRLGCTKIALGHHRDDAIATLLLNLFFVGKLKAMPPVLQSDDGRNTVIRPMIYVPESHLVEISKRLAFPIIPCGLCSQQPDMKRARMGELMRAMEELYPGALGSALAAIGDVQGRFLLDKRLWTTPRTESDRHADAFA